MIGTTYILWLLAGAGLFAGMSVMQAYRSRWDSVMWAYVALWIVKAGGAVLSIGQLIFWGVASAIAIGIMALLPEQVRKSTLGVGFIVTGALAGMALGILANTISAIIAGAALGAVFGGVAASRTRGGRVLDFPTKRFFNYLCAKGLPAVVSISMIGILATFLIP